VQDRDGVVVHVDDPGLRRLLLGDLVRIARGRQAGADVEELPDTRLGDQVPDRAGQESPVGPYGLQNAGERFVAGLGGPAIGLEVVLAAQPVVIDPGRVGNTGIDAFRQLRHDADHTPAARVTRTENEPSINAQAISLPSITQLSYARSLNGICETRLPLRQSAAALSGA
jgi:hypothetical protein